MLFSNSAIPQDLNKAEHAQPPLQAARPPGRGKQQKLRIQQQRALWETAPCQRYCQGLKDHSHTSIHLGAAKQDVEQALNALLSAASGMPVHPKPHGHRQFVTG